MLRKNVASQHVFFALVNATTGAAVTSASITGKMGLDAAAQASVTGTFTELGGGQYRFDPSQADTNADYLGYLFTATGAVPVGANFITTGGNFADGVRFGLTALPNAAASAAGGLPTFGTSSGQITASSGQVTVATNNDKTGYTASTVSDKTGYALTQAFPTNFSALAVTAGGAVTVGTISDKTGYSLAASQTFNVTGNITGNLTGSVGSVTVVSDKTGYALTSAYDPAKTAAQAGNAMTLTAAYDLAKTAAQVGSAMTLDLTQAVPTTNTAQTTGDALNAARAQGFGKWAVSGTTLTLYANDGTTAVRTFTLNDATNPTSRI